MNSLTQTHKHDNTSSSDTPEQSASLSALGLAALHYAKRGLYIFPLHYPTGDGKCSCGGRGCDLDPATGLFKGKHPLTKNGVKDATTDAATIRAWWERWPNANIGLDCERSGLVVVDLDGERGLTSWATLVVLLRLNVKTRAARTGGGGLHLYFAAPVGQRIGNSTSKLGAGIDVRGAGGYVMMPPSIHPNGNRYEWE